MQRLKKILSIVIVTFGIIALWYWADDNDYFQTDYKDLTIDQKKIFKWQDGDTGESIMNRYRKHFADTAFYFPGNRVSKVKLFKNIPLVGVFTGRTLKKEHVNSFVEFCNDSVNFDWGETTWDITESEYYCKLYNSENDVVGKIYLCLYDCGMIKSRPFCPTMKFGGLSERGSVWIYNLIDNEDNWQ
ncbi:MAG: hypothetical protein N4A72_22680 [Bacteroidales bacterium]|nr:hypothetical protein [Bacteroidales bacterium]